MNFTVKNVTINGIGIALFVVLSLCLQVPVFENYYICLGYVVMTAYCYIVGITSGTIVSTLGVVLYCLLINGLRGMPGWAIANFALSIAMGIIFKYSKKMKNSLLEIIICSIFIIIATAIAMLLIKSGVEFLLYGEPIIVRMAKNVYAFVADAFVIVVSIPICKYLEPKLNKYL